MTDTKTDNAAREIPNMDADDPKKTPELDEKNNNTFSLESLLKKIKYSAIKVIIGITKEAENNSLYFES